MPKTAEEHVAALTGAGNTEAEEAFTMEVEGRLGDASEPEGKEEGTGGEGDASSEEHPDGEGGEVQSAKAGGEDGEKEDGEPPKGFVKQEDYDKVHREAVKRRHADKERRDEMVALRQEVAETREAILNPPPELTPEERQVWEDPAVQIITGEIDQLREDAGLTPEAVKSRAVYQQEIERRSTVAEYTKASADSFRSANSDYDGALNHAIQSRSRQLSRLGYDAGHVARLINEEAREICEMAYDRGENPAKTLYEMAVEDYGWQAPAPGGEGGDKTVTTPAKPYVREMSSVERIRKGLGQQSVDSMHGDRGGPDSLKARGKMTKEQFFNEVDAGQRLEILADGEKFEELEKTGEITVDWM
jgi:hypothetical protein